MSSKKQVRFSDGEDGAQQISTFIKTWNRVAQTQGTGRSDVCKAMVKEKILRPLLETNGADGSLDALGKLSQQVKALRESVKSQPEVYEALSLDTLTGRGRPSVDKQSLALATAILMGVEKTGNDANT